MASASSSADKKGFFCATDPDQEKDGYYKVARTENIDQTMSTLNASRANRDFKLVRFFPCKDLKQLEEYIKKALKSRFISNSIGWVKVEANGIDKVLDKIEALVSVVDDA
jgi:hypothetical protein